MEVSVLLPDPSAQPSPSRGQGSVPAEDVARLAIDEDGKIVYSRSAPGTPRDAGEPAPVFDYEQLWRAVDANA